MLTTPVPDTIKPVFDDLIDTMASYGYHYDDDQSKEIPDGAELAFIKEGARYVLTVLDSGRDLWSLLSNGFISRGIIDTIIRDFSGPDHTGCIDAEWVSDFR